MVMFRRVALDTALGAVQLFRGGDGPPLVYLHSAGGETSLEVLEDLATSFDVIVPVLPGWGESEGVDAIDGPEDVVFHLLDVWDALGPRRHDRRRSSSARRSGPGWHSSSRRGTPNVSPGSCS